MAEHDENEDDLMQATASMSVIRELGEYLEDNLSAFEQVISRAMSLQLIHGWPMKEAVREAMKEVTPATSTN